jgi:hypothetical protein
MGVPRIGLFLVAVFIVHKISGVPVWFDFRSSETATWQQMGQAPIRTLNTPSDSKKGGGAPNTKKGTSELPAMSASRSC